MPPWSKNDAVTISTLRDELQSFASQALREELTTFAGMMSSQVVNNLERISNGKSVIPFSSSWNGGNSNGSMDPSHMATEQDDAAVAEDSTAFECFTSQTSFQLQRSFQDSRSSRGSVDRSLGSGSKLNENESFDQDESFASRPSDHSRGSIQDHSRGSVQRMKRMRRTSCYAAEILDGWAPEAHEGANEDSQRDRNSYKLSRVSSVSLACAVVPEDAPGLGGAGTQVASSGSSSVPARRSADGRTIQACDRNESDEVVDASTYARLHSGQFSDDDDNRSVTSHVRASKAAREASRITADIRHSAQYAHPDLGPWGAFLNGKLFTNTVAMMIFLNLVLMTVETEYMALNPKQFMSADSGPPIFGILDSGFCVFFVAEIMMRIWVHGRYYFAVHGWKWNIFECVVTGLQVVDTAIRLLYPAGPDVKLPTMVHMLRAVRFLRVLRLLRIVHITKDLRVLCNSIIEALKPLLWTLLLLTLIIFTFSVFLTMVVTNHRMKKLLQDDPHKRSLLSLNSLNDFDTALMIYYGSIERSALSLYQMISDGVHWGDLVAPLRQINPWLDLVFAAYSALTVIVMMNIVMGIFVDSVMRTTESHNKRDLMLSMKRLFEESDADGSGTIDWQEFEAQLSNPAMQDYLKDIDLDEQGAHDLFNLLDVDDADEISAADFVSGCSRLSGAAKAMDLAVMQHEQRTFHTMFENHRDLVERSLSFLTDQTSALAEAGKTVDAEAQSSQEKKRSFLRMTRSGGGRSGSRIFEDEDD